MKEERERERMRSNEVRSKYQVPPEEILLRRPSDMGKKPLKQAGGSDTSRFLPASAAQNGSIFLAFAVATILE